eukprot:CFRG6698T1
MTAMQEVVHGLFIGGIDSVSPEALASNDISAVVTLLKDFKSDLPEGTEHILLPIDDEEDQDILVKLETVLDFIKKHLCAENGRVLVHCHAGVSRSAAIVCAYLMKTENLSVNDALEKLNTVCPGAEPNRGFMKQLSMYQQMKCSLDPSNPYYSFYLVQLMAARKLEGYSVTEDDFSATDTAKVAGDMGYRCRKCRNMLFSEKQVLPHETGNGQEAFKWRKRNEHYDHNAPPTDMCGSYFLVPIKWMAKAIVGEGSYDGKLCCEKCDAKIGSFNWSGSQCSCGAWVGPAFQVNKKMVDGIRKF